MAIKKTLHINLFMIDAHQDERCEIVTLNTHIKINAQFVDVSYKRSGNQGHHCRNVRRKCKKLTNTLL